MRKCETCVFRSERPYINADRGAAEFGAVMFGCRRRAPIVTGGMMSHTITAWPMVTNDDWCGEHKPKDTNHDG